MNKLKLSVLATACILALTACSSGKGKGGDYLNGEANKRIQELNARVDEAKKQVAAAEQKAKEAEKASETALNQQKAEATAQANKAAEEAKAELDKVTAEKAAVEKELADAKAQLAAIEKEKQDELDRSAAAEKAEQERVVNNVAETKKVVTDSGSETKTLPRGEYQFSYVSGKHILIEDGKLTDKPLTEKQKDLNKLVLDGVSMDLFTEEDIRTSHSSGRMTKVINQDGKNGTVVGLPSRAWYDDFAQLRYGYVTENGKTVLFVQGHITPEVLSKPEVVSPYDHSNYFRSPEFGILDVMPADGKVYEYKGSAFYGKDNVYQSLAAEAVVDFGSKKMKAELKENNVLKATLGANLIGNTFSGSHNGVHTQGAFFGNKGIDIGGTFYVSEGDNKDYNGVFGATKQGCSWLGCTDVPEKALTNFDVK